MALKSQDPLTLVLSPSSVEVSRCAIRARIFKRPFFAPPIKTLLVLASATIDILEFVPSLLGALANTVSTLTISDAEWIESIASSRGMPETMRVASCLVNRANSFPENPDLERLMVK